jgi:hypothetical protein
MKDNNRRLVVPAVVVAGCLAFLLLLIGLASRSGAGDDNPAVGFPIVLVVLAVVSLVVALAWRAVSRRKASSRS